MNWPDSLPLSRVTQLYRALAKEPGCQCSQHRPYYRLDEYPGSPRQINVPKNHMNLVAETATHKAFYRSVLGGDYVLQTLYLKEED